jgi:hypothetical protein
MNDPADIAVASLFVDSAVSAVDSLPPNWLAGQGWVEAPRRDLGDDLRRFGRPIPVLIDDTKPDPLLLVLLAATYRG